MKNTIKNNDCCFEHRHLIIPAKSCKCSTTPTNLTDKQAKELLIDHLFSGIRETIDGEIYKPNPHNVTSEQINISYTDPETEETVTSILTEVINSILQNVHGLQEEYNNRKTLTLKQTDFSQQGEMVLYDTKSNVVWEIKSMTQTDINTIL